MVTTTDYINIISNMDSKNAIKGFNQLDTAMSNFQSKLSGAKGFSKFNSQLKDAGLVMRRNGQIQRQGTIQTISQAKAMNMILDREKQVLSLKQERMALMAKPEGMEEMFAIRQTGTELGRAKKEGLDVTNQINEMNKRLAKSPKMARAFANGMKQGRKSFDMFNLSLLFSGMQIKMFGQAVMKFMIPSMDKLNQLNTEGAKEVMAMNASFEFLKISMFEALSNTGIFQTFIEYLIKAAEWSSEFIQNNPGWAVAGIVIAAAATAIGTSFVIASGWNQFASTVYGMWSGGTGIKAMLGTTGKGGKIGKALTGFKNFVDNNQNLIMKFGISMGGAAISAAAITSMLNTEDLAGKVGFGIAGALGAAGAITAWFNPMVGLTLVVAGTVLFALTKYRFEIAGEMNKDKILRDYLKGAGLYNIDMEKEMAAYSLHGATGTTATVYDVDKMGIVASDNLLKQYIRTNSELEELQKQLNMNAEQGKFDEVRAIQSKIDKTQEEMSNVMEIGMIADKNFTKRIENEMKIII